MSYVVLARKWRPLTFDAVVGQDHICRTLKNAVRSGRVAHAYLFAGSRGVGKTSAARILAKCLNCDHGPTPDPCNQCPSCEEITAGTSLDVYEIDGASNTSVDDIRELRENVRYMPRPGKRKIYIIDEVHMLSKSAFNALLKTLEEPPEHVIFIFATTEPHKIPETIQSRCQRYDFRRIPQRTIQARLREMSSSECLEISNHAISLIAKAADGSMRDAQSLLDQMISYCGKEIPDEAVSEILGLAGREIFLRISQAVLDGDPAACLQAVEDLYRQGIDFAQLYKDLVEHFRNLLVSRVIENPSEILDLPDSHIGELKRQASDSSIEDLQRLLSLLIDAEDHILRASLPKVGLEVTLVKMAALARLTPLADILKKIEAIEGSLRDRPEAGRPRTGIPHPSGGLRGGIVSATEESAGNPRVHADNGPVPARAAATPHPHDDPPASPSPSSALPSPHPTPALHPVEAQEGWARFVQTLEEDNAVLAAQIKNVASWELSAGALTVFCAEGSFTMEKLKHPESRAVLAEYARACFGREDLTFNVRPNCRTPHSESTPASLRGLATGTPTGRNGTASGRPFEKKGGEDRLGRMDTEGGGPSMDPAVEAALEIFGATIKERKHIDQDRGVPRSSDQAGEQAG